MITRRLLIIGIALILLFTGAWPAHAIRLMDEHYCHDRLDQSPCITEEDIRAFEIRKRRGKGLNADFHDAQQMITLLLKLYGCDLMEEEMKGDKDHPHQDGLVFFLFRNDRRSRSSQLISLFDILGYNPVSTVAMGEHARLYPTLEAALASEAFSGMVKKHGARQMFVQAMDILLFENAGLYDHRGRLVPGGMASARPAAPLEADSTEGAAEP